MNKVLLLFFPDKTITILSSFINSTLLDLFEMEKVDFFAFLLYLSEEIFNVSPLSVMLDIGRESACSVCFFLCRCLLSWRHSVLLIGWQAFYPEWILAFIKWLKASYGCLLVAVILSNVEIQLEFLKQNLLCFHVLTFLYVLGFILLKSF